MGWNFDWPKLTKSALFKQLPLRLNLFLSNTSTWVFPSHPKATAAGLIQKYNETLVLCCIETLMG